MTSRQFIKMQQYDAKYGDFVPSLLSYQQKSSLSLFIKKAIEPLCQVCE